MKSLLKILSVLVVLAIVHLPATAQDEALNKIPRWTPDEGYWVAQTNVNEPQQCTIFFYTDNHELIYKETIEGVKLDLQTRRVKMRLKKVLATSLQAWHEQKQVKENEGLVINLLQRK
jgi:hypothetical protein